MDETIIETAVDLLPDLELVGAEAGIQENLQPQHTSSSPFTDRAFDEDETIIITAPGDYYAEDCHVAAAAGETASSSEAQATSATQTDAQGDEASPVIMPASDNADDSPEGETERRGIFSRFWSIFRRKR
jgi:hypothetical protein